MKISLKFLQLNILTYALATISTRLAIPASAPPVAERYVDSQLIKTRELSLRSDNYSTLEERQVPTPGVWLVPLTIVAIVALIVGVALIAEGARDENEVSSNLTLLR
jgi:hypothetical protein